MTLKAPLSISPSSPGKLLLAGKYAKKLGLCQCVMPALWRVTGLFMQAEATAVPLHGPVMCAGHQQLQRRVAFTHGSPDSPAQIVASAVLSRG